MSRWDALSSSSWNTVTTDRRQRRETRQPKSDHHRIASEQQRRPSSSRSSGGCGRSSDNGIGPRSWRTADDSSQHRHHDPTISGKSSFHRIRRNFRHNDSFPIPRSSDFTSSGSNHHDRQMPSSSSSWKRTRHRTEPSSTGKGRLLQQRSTSLEHTRTESNVVEQEEIKTSNSRNLEQSFERLCQLLPSYRLEGDGVVLERTGQDDATAILHVLEEMKECVLFMQQQGQESVLSTATRSLKTGSLSRRIAQLLGSIIVLVFPIQEGDGGLLFSSSRQQDETNGSSRRTLHSAIIPVRLATMELCYCIFKLSSLNVKLDRVQVWRVFQRLMMIVQNHTKGQVRTTTDPPVDESQLSRRALQCLVVFVDKFMLLSRDDSIKCNNSKNRDYKQPMLEDTMLHSLIERQILPTLEQQMQQHQKKRASSIMTWSEQPHSDALSSRENVIVNNELFDHLNCLQRILEVDLEVSGHNMTSGKAPSIASSLFLPCTTNVTAGGEEIMEANRVGKRLLFVLQTFLPFSCVCFIIVVEILERQQEQQRKSGLWNKQLQLQPNFVQLRDYFQSSVREVCTTSDNQNDLRLLQALLRTYGETASQPFMSLVFNDYQDANSELTPPKVLSLVDALHKATHPLQCEQHAILIMDCIRYTIDSLPLSRWIVTTSATTTTRTFRQGSKMRLLRDQVVSGLSYVIRVVTSSFTEVLQQSLRSNVSFLVALCNMCQTLLSRTPFCGSDELSDVALELLDAMGELYVRGCTAAISRLQHGDDDTLPPCWLDCWLTCMGGKVQPNGETSAMVIPLELWLISGESKDRKFKRSSSSSNQFCHFLWSHAVSHDWSRQILGSWIHMKSSMVIVDKDCWHNFEYILQELMVVPSMVEASMDLMRLFMLGTAASATATASLQCNTEVSETILLLTGRVLQDDSMSAKEMVGALRVCHSMNHVVWNHIIMNSNDFRHLSLILDLCRDTSTAAVSVKAMAFQVLGEASSHLFGSHSILTANGSEEATKLSGSVAVVLSNALSNRHSSGMKPSIFRMVVLALGNFALIMSQSENAIAFEKRGALVDELFSATLALLHPRYEDDKVINNTIRAIGHLARWRFSTIRQVEEAEAHFNNSNFETALDLLQKELSAALSDSRGNVSGRTWKQRSVAKKHAWGACQSISLIMVSAFASSVEWTACSSQLEEGIASYATWRRNKLTFRKVCESLVDCLDPELSSTLHTKIIRGAVRCLLDIPRELLLSVSSSADGKVLGRLTSYYLLYWITQGDSSTEELFQYSLRIPLLPEDATYIICSVTTSALHNYYNALVQKMASGGDGMVPRQTFQYMSDALLNDLNAPSAHGNGAWHLDEVRLQQLFCSRAAQQQRKAYERKLEALVEEEL